MEQLAVDVLGAFIAGLDLSSPILSSSDSLGQTTVVVENVFQARSGLECLVDAVPFTIANVDYDAKTVTLTDIAANPSIFRMPSPFYFHGTPYATNAHISYLKDAEKVPMVYLLEILRETIPSEDSAYVSIAEFRMFFLDVANFEAWSTDDHYSKVIRPQRNLVDAFIKQARNSQFFGLVEQLELIAHVKFGVYQSEKGHLNSLFNDRLTGIELKGSFPIIGCCNC